MYTIDYQLPMKLRDGIFYSCVSSQEGITVQGPSPAPMYKAIAPPVQSHGPDPRSVQVPGLSLPTGLQPPLDMFKLIHFEGQTVGDQAVGILLKYLLVDISLSFSGVDH